MRLTIIYDNALSAEPPGPAGVFISGGNLAAVAYWVEAETGLGETPQATGELRGSYCKGFFKDPVAEMKKKEMDFLKLVISLERLKEMGVLDDPTLPTLPGGKDFPWPKPVIEKWPTGPIGPLGPAPDLIRQLTTVPPGMGNRKATVSQAAAAMIKEIVETYYAYMDDRPVDPGALRRLGEALKKASSLPDVKRSEVKLRSRKPQNK
jgi:hypothetical protein